MSLPERLPRHVLHTFSTSARAATAAERAAHSQLSRVVLCRNPESIAVERRLGSFRTPVVLLPKEGNVHNSPLTKGGHGGVLQGLSLASEGDLERKLAATDGPQDLRKRTGRPLHHGPLGVWELPLVRSPHPAAARPTSPARGEVVILS